MPLAQRYLLPATDVVADRPARFQIPLGRALLDHGLLTPTSVGILLEYDLALGCIARHKCPMGLNLGHHFAQTDGRT